MNWFEKLPDNLKGVLILMVAALAFSIMSLIVKLAGERLHVTQILLVRQAGMVIMVAPAILRNFPGSLRTARLDLQLTRIGFALVAMLGGFSALIHLPLADATALFFAKSFFVTIFAVWFLHEHVGIYRWSAVAIGFIGVLLMLQPGTDNFSIWGLASIAGAAGAGMVMVIIRILSRTDHPNTTITYQALGVGLLMLIPGLYFWQWPTPWEWGLLVALGVVSYYGQKGNIYAYKYGEASLLASLDYSRLIYATLLGYLVFDHIPGTMTWVGAGIVVSAAVFSIYREAVRQQSIARGPAPD